MLFGGKGTPSAGARGVSLPPEPPIPPPARFIQKDVRDGDAKVFRRSPSPVTARDVCSSRAVFVQEGVLERFGREEGARRQRGRGKTFFLLAFFLLKK